MKKRQMYIMALAAICISFRCRRMDGGQTEGLSDAADRGGCQYGAGGGRHLRSGLFSAARKDIGVNVSVTNLTGAAGSRPQLFCPSRPTATRSTISAPSS